MLPLNWLTLSVFTLVCLILQKYCFGTFRSDAGNEILFNLQLEQTEDFDERRKIRADLRAVRKKMLDSLSATAEAESNERAARRAERARARKAEEESNHVGPTITDHILSEIDDEYMLQKLVSSFRKMLPKILIG